MASVLSAPQGIPVPAQSLTERDGLKLKSIFDNEELLAHFGYTGGDAKDFWQKQIQRVEDISSGKIKLISDEQVAEQRAQPVHSVFRANGKIVAFYGHNSGITSTNAMGRVDWGASKDETAQNIFDRLTKVYGNIEMETYSAESGVTVGMAGDEMFGRGPQIPSPEAAFKAMNETSFASSRLQTSAEALALFQEARKWFGR
ncbi:MAG: hypothetical protein COB46_03285 [Rhodospirillaceae bacterium]|nr:MAG: hypothetical protein COB46_03285 [Rhodospirillaceae bacterium]